MKWKGNLTMSASTILVKAREFLLGGEKSQILLMSIGIITVTLVIGMVAVDAGAWFNEKRNLQKVADSAALAGAQEYIGDTVGAWDTSAAHDAAMKWALENGGGLYDATLTITEGTSNCRGTGDSMPWVEVTAERPSPLLFSRLVDFFRDSSFHPFPIPATARACAGSPRSVEELSPFGVETGFVTDTSKACEADYGKPLSDCLEVDLTDPTKTRPVYGAVCILKTGAQNPSCVNTGGQRGVLTIGNIECAQKSSNTIVHDFHYGTLAACTVGQDVYTGSGNIVGQIRKGLADRLDEERLEARCDQLFSTGHAGYDDFDEVFSLVEATPGPIVPSALNCFSKNECSITRECDEGESHTFIPRVLDLILINELQNGENTATITGFAGFYVIGCFPDDDAQATKEAIEVDLTQMYSYLNRCEGAGAHDDILGVFVQTLAPPSDVGNPDPSLPMSVVLVK